MEEVDGDKEEEEEEKEGEVVAGDNKVVILVRDGERASPHRLKEVMF